MSITNYLARGGIQTTPGDISNTFQNSRANALNQARQKQVWGEQDRQIIQQKINDGLVQLVGEVNGVPDEVKPQAWQQGWQRITSIHPVIAQQYGDMGQYDPNTHKALEGGLRAKGLMKDRMSTDFMPSSVKEWQFFNSLGPEGKEEYLQMKRSDQVIPLGGQTIVRGPSGNVRERYTVTPKPEQMPEFQGRQAEAEAAGKGRGEATAAQAKKEFQAGDTLAILNEIEKWLPKATASGAGAAADASARFFGHATEGAKAASRLRVLAPQLVLKVPRMEGPQSNQDAVLYRQAAGDLGNETLPVEERMAALQTLRELNERYAHLNGGTPQSPAKQSGSLPSDVTEDDIQETMRANNMTREQVLEAISGR